MKISPSDILTTAYRTFSIDRQMWLRPWAVVGVLLVSIALPLVLSERWLNLILGLLIAAAGVLILMRWPPLGMVALVIISLLVPSPRLPGGLNIAVLFLALLIGMWILDMVVRKGEIILITSRTFKPLIFFIIVLLLAFGMGQLTWFRYAPSAPLDAQVGGLAIFILSGGAFLLAAHQIRGLQWLQILTWVFLAFGSLHIIGWLIPEVGRFSSLLFQRGTYNNSLFWIWLISLSLSQAILNRKLPMILRFALAGLVLAAWYVGFILNYGWKSGWLPPLVSVVIILGLLSWRLGSIVAIIGFAIGPAIVTRAISTDLYSYSTRFEAWQILLKIIQVNPILGLGPANYYLYTSLFRIRGYITQFNSHNNYIDIIAQTGLVGLACFSWFAWEVGRLGWRLRDQSQEGFEQAYVYGALGGLGGMLAAGMLADWFLPFVYNIGLTGFRMSMLGWVFLGALVSIDQIVSRRNYS